MQQHLQERLTEAPWCTAFPRRYAPQSRRRRASLSGPPVALTGVVGGGSVQALVPLLNQAKIPLVGSNGRPQLKDVAREWHTSFLSDEPGAAIAKYVHDKIPGTVFAIGPDYQGGYDELRGFTEAFKAAGGQLANKDGKATFTPFPGTTN